jgi:tRNA splicing ligase
MTMNITEYLDVAKLRQHINIGLVTERFHDTLPLAIYCYGRKAVHEQQWDDVTRKTRGLIVDLTTGDIIARPYEKFFDKEQSELILGLDIEAVDVLFGPATVTEKVNGSLGIFWRYGIHWGVASKGSFHSPHAEFATKWLENRVEENGPLVFPEGYTPVLEIICQEIQPHVIKYPEDGLFLIGLIKLDTGEEISWDELYSYGFKNRINIPSQVHNHVDYLFEMDSSEFEGVVLTYDRPGQSPFKVKVKFPTFLKNRKEFYAELKRQEDPRKSEDYLIIFTEASNLLRDALAVCTTRKEFADFFKRSAPELTPVCFAMMDEKDYKKVIWRILGKQRDNQAVTP